jgi:hypothetical protein
MATTTRQTVADLQEQRALLGSVGSSRVRVHDTVHVAAHAYAAPAFFGDIEGWLWRYHRSIECGTGPDACYSLCCCLRQPTRPETVVLQ